jgi:hypothetical protein
MLAEQFRSQPLRGIAGGKEKLRLMRTKISHVGKK